MCISRDWNQSFDHFWTSYLIYFYLSQNAVWFCKTTVRVEWFSWSTLNECLISFWNNPAPVHSKHNRELNFAISCFSSNITVHRITSPRRAAADPVYERMSEKISPFSITRWIDTRNRRFMWRYYTHCDNGRMCFQLPTYKKHCFPSGLTSLCFFVALKCRLKQRNVGEVPFYLGNFAPWITVQLINHGLSQISIFNCTPTECNWKLLEKCHFHYVTSMVLRKIWASDILPSGCIL